MDVLIASKRRPRNRDLLERPFGRFHHLPAELARHGHRVTVLLASYANEPDACVEREGVTVRSISVRGAGAARYLALVRRLARSERPDWIGGLSDTWYAVLAAQLARRTGARLWVDAYDNYASYIPWAWPLHAAWRRGPTCSAFCLGPRARHAGQVHARQPHSRPAAQRLAHPQT